MKSVILYKKINAKLSNINYTMQKKMSVKLSVITYTIQKKMNAKLTIINYTLQRKWMQGYLLSIMQSYSNIVRQGNWCMHTSILSSEYHIEFAKLSWKIILKYNSINAKVV